MADKVDLNCRHLQLSAVIPRFTVQFGETKYAQYIGETVNRDTIEINLHIGLPFGGAKTETVNRGKW